MRVVSLFAVAALVACATIAGIEQPTDRILGDGGEAHDTGNPTADGATTDAGVLPARCADIAANTPSLPDGTYTLYFQRDSRKPWIAYLLMPTI